MRHGFGRMAAKAAVLLLALLTGSSGFSGRLSAESLPAGHGAVTAPAKRPVEATAAPRSHTELLEREAAIGVKEKELKKLESNLDGKIRELGDTRKKMESTMSQQKNAGSERSRKVIKLFKALKPEQAAKLIDKLDEDSAMEILGGMDQKTVAKLVPYMNQDRVLKWTRMSLRGE